MDSSNFFVSSPSVIAGLPPALSCAAVATEGLWLVQRLQWEALLAWQGALAGIQRELWDQWTTQYAGGVPLDA